MIELRPANMGDSDRLFVWRNDADARANSRNTAEIAREDHDAWMEAVVQRGFPHHLVMIAESGPLNVGVVRFHAATRNDAPAFEISIAVSLTYRGFGFGQQMLATACTLLPDFPLLAEIRKTNIASQTIFERCGFKSISWSGSLDDDPGNFVQYRREPQP